ncbi:MAG: hypothetical protein AAFY73_14750 [Pseudomonadota bacterium]
MLRAVSRDPVSPKVTVEDVEWGYAILQRSIDCIEGGIVEYMASSAFEELQKAIKRAIASEKGGSITQSKLLRKRGVSMSEPRHFDAAIKRLQQTGEILPPTIINGGARFTLAG